MKLENLEAFESPAEYAAYLQEFINECGRELAFIEELRISAEERLLQVRIAEKPVDDQDEDENIYFGEVLK